MRAFLENLIAPLRMGRLLLVLIPMAAAVGTLCAAFLWSLDAATRARFMELAVARLPNANRQTTDAAFLTGVFSLVDAVFGDSLERTLEDLTLSRHIRAAILKREGVLGTLLSAVEALEYGDWAALDRACETLVPLTAAELAELALNAAAWATSADHSADSQGLERLDD